MATYKIRGERWLRKYTAATLTPAAYAATSDAATIADTLCRLTWERSLVTDATMTSHSTDEQERNEVTKCGLDWNVTDRENFDAAVWCSEHSGGAHRAYAQAACYKIRLPDMATYPNVTSLKVTATSDPYNKSGLRIHFVTSATGTIPTACATVRNNDSSGTMIADGTSASGVAPRTVTNSKAYTTTAAATLTPTATKQLEKYLMVFVLKESYTEVNGTWLDGCGFIRNEIEITTDGAIDGWTDGDTIDASMDFGDADAYGVVDAGSTPVIGEATLTGRRTLTGVAGGANGLHAAYRTMLEGGGEQETTGEDEGATGNAAGAYWRVRQTVKGWEIESGVETIPLVVPEPYAAVRFTYGALSMSSGAKYRVFLKSGSQQAPTADDLKLAALWDGIGETGEWTLVGEITDGTSAIFKLGDLTDTRYVTLMIVGYLAPNKVATTPSLAFQGTGDAFMPKVELV